MKSRLLTWLIIGTEMIIIIILTARIFNARRNILGFMNVSPVQRERFIFPVDSPLKHFYEPKPNSVFTGKEDWLPFGYVYSINADSLKETRDYAIPKPKATLRLIAIGDSFTFGEYTNNENTYPKHLESILNSQLYCPSAKKYEVINLGVTGYDIQYTVHRFERRGLKYQPDVVLWFMRLDDFVAPNEILTEKALAYEKTIRASGQLEEYRARGIFDPGWSLATIELNRERGWESLAKDEYANLAEMNRIYDGYLVIFADANLPADIKTMIKIFSLSRQNIFFWDSLNDYDKLADGHPSAIGHGQIADSLFNYLTNQKIIPCN